MKTFLPILALLLFAFAPQSAAAAAPGKKKTETVRIQSTAICDMCERTIETELIYTKGVKKVDVDLETASVSVVFDPRKTDAAKVRTALTKLGYSADGTPGDAAAFAKLPACCQKEGCGKLPEKP